MKKRIGTLKGKPIVEGGGSNIIKKNEVSINDIGSSSDSSNSNDDDISYFGINLNDKGDPSIYGILMRIFTLSKGVHFVSNPVKVFINGLIGTFDSNFFYEFGGNINDKSIYDNGIWYSIKEFLSKQDYPIEAFKPISKEDFYRTNYTQEEARKIAEDYYNYALQFAPSETQ